MRTSTCILRAYTPCCTRRNYRRHACITPYHTLIDSQVKKLRLLLRDRNLGAVRVGTVDDFQGQEARIIFISTVLSGPADSPLMAGRSKPGGVPTPAPYEVAPDPAVGFFRNPNRFNVAITRAQALMVVLGHPLVLMQVRAPPFCGAGTERHTCWAEVHCAHPQGHM